jgi:hypothetical protein
MDEEHVHNWIYYDELQMYYCKCGILAQPVLWSVPCPIHNWSYGIDGYKCITCGINMSDSLVMGVST